MKGVQHFMKKFDVSEYDIFIKKIPKSSEGLKFIMISDLHSNEYGINLHEVNKVIKESKPDAILLAGDIISRKLNPNVPQIVSFLTTLAKHYPVYYALGNHEYKLKRFKDEYGDFYDIYKDTLEEAGIVFLEDESAIFDKDDYSVVISGVQIDLAYYRHNAPVMGSGLMDKHMGCPDKNMYQILLAHNPDYFKQYAEWGADLVLAGHVHGGTVRLPGIGGVIGTNMKFFPKYADGVHCNRKSKMIVSRGLGTHTIKIRINNRPELVIVNVLPWNEY